MSSGKNVKALSILLFLLTMLIFSTLLVAFPVHANDVTGGNATTGEGTTGTGDTGDSVDTGGNVTGDTGSTADTGGNVTTDTGGNATTGSTDTSSNATTDTGGNVTSTTETSGNVTTTITSTNATTQEASNITQPEPSNVTQPAKIWTDKEDYASGETVTIFGSGFLACREVTITIERPDGVVDRVYATTADDGGFTCTYQLNGILGTYTVTATDGTNTATTAFTDALNVQDVWSTDSTGTAKTSFLTTEGVYAKISIVGSETSITVHIYVLSSLPRIGGSLNDVSTGYETESFTSSGDYGPFCIWSSPSAGSYIIFVDEDRDGVRDGSEKYSTFTVTAAPQTVSITITSDPTGSGFVKVDGVAITTPETFTWTVGDTHTLEALSPVSGGTGVRYVWTSWSDSGAQTHDYVVPSSAATVKANYKTQYYLTVSSDHDTPGGEGWYDENANAYATLATGTVSGGTGIRYVFTGWSGDASGTDLTSIAITMDGPKTATANWKTQFLVTFDQSGLDSSATGTVVTVDDSAKTYNDLPFSKWVDSDSSVSYAYETTVSSSASGKRFSLDSVTGPASPITVTVPLTITGKYKTQFLVTFDQIGVGTDFTGTVVTIDGTGYGVSDFPVSCWWDKDSTHSFAFQSPLSVSGTDRYKWTSTSGLSVEQSATAFKVTESGSITGNYKTLATVTYTGDTIVPTTSSTINLRATVQEAGTPLNPDDITRATVCFVVVDTRTGMTNNLGPFQVFYSGQPGVGVASYKLTDELEEGAYLVTVKFEPKNQYYTGYDSEPATITVYTPTGAFTTGGGWILDSTGSHGNFGFVVRYNKSGKTQGQSVYVYRQDGYDWVIKSTAWTGLAIGTDGTASFQGKATVQKIDPSTGQVVWSDGNYQFTVKVYDAGTNNKKVDTYSIVVLDKNGQPFHNAYGNLEGGQIVNHLK